MRVARYFGEDHFVTLVSLFPHQIAHTFQNITEKIDHRLLRLAPSSFIVSLPNHDRASFPNGAVRYVPVDRIPVDMPVESFQARNVKRDFPSFAASVPISEFTNPDKSPQSTLKQKTKLVGEHSNLDPTPLETKKSKKLVTDAKPIVEKPELKQNPTENKRQTKTKVVKKKKKKKKTSQQSATKPQSAASTPGEVPKAAPVKISTKQMKTQSPKKDFKLLHGLRVHTERYYFFSLVL